MYKTIHKFTPVYLQEIFISRNTSYNLREAENMSTWTKNWLPKTKLQL